jgi:hypothetical protein
MGIRASAWSIGLAPALLAAGIGVAAAQEDICSHLEARLASLTQQGQGQDGGYAQYNSAVARQRAELDRATGQARAAGCTGGFILFQNRRDPRCGGLMANINRMRANLTRLSAARDRFSGGFGSFGVERERQQILRNLAFNQCGPQYASFNRRSIFSSLFGPQRGWWDNGGFGGGFDPYGTFRTLCVRTCDGYYFPISFATTQTRFAQDQETCQSMCPGTEVALYVHRSPGEDSEAMVSLTGEPYTALPAAFKYRKEYDKACACGTPTAIATAAAEGNMTPVDPSAFVRPIPPLPLARPGSGEDPETLANRTGEFMPKPVEFQPPATSPVAGLGPDGKPIRIVGPSYIVTQ